MLADCHSVNKVDQWRYLMPPSIKLTLQRSILQVMDKLVRTFRGKASEALKAAYVWAILEGEPSGRTTSDGHSTATDWELQPLLQGMR